MATAVAAGHFQDLEKIRESDFICFPSLFPEGESKMGWGWGSGGQTSRRPASLGPTHLEGPFFASLPPSFVHTSKQTRHVGQWWLSLAGVAGSGKGSGRRSCAGWLAARQLRGQTVLWRHERKHYEGQNGPLSFSGGKKFLLNECVCDVFACVPAVTPQPDFHARCGKKTTKTHRYFNAQCLTAGTGEN